MADTQDPPNVEEVFRDFRQEISRHDAASDAEVRYKLGLAYRDMGMIDASLKELARAAESPHLRFEASALIGRLLRDRGDLVPAVEWFERAAETPPPSREAGRELLYDLARTLEGGGEEARALAVYLELQADAGEFRDVPARVARLSRPQPGE